MKSSKPEKVYDQPYFDQWYRAAGKRVVERGSLKRRVSMAVSVTEYVLGRPLRTVLDVGCGEGAWRAPLLAARPRLSYLGLDSSRYAVARYGASRNIAYARFADLDSLRPCAPVDLLVCADVAHYLSSSELRRGISGFAELCSGVLYLEAYCRGDAIEGDLEGFIARPAQAYRRLLLAQGFRPLAPYCWLSPSLAEQDVALARPAS